MRREDPQAREMRLATVAREVRTRTMAQCETRACDGTGRISQRLCPCRWEDRITMALVRAGVPVGVAEAHRVRLDQDDGQGPARRGVLRWGERIERAIEHGLGLLVHGGVGAGKTTAVANALRVAIRQLHPKLMVTRPTLRWVNLPELGREPPEGWSTVPIAVIDELGKEPDDDRGRGLVDRLLRARQGRVTVVITNLDPDKTLPRYGHSVASLLRALAEVRFSRAVDHRVTPTLDLLEGP